MPVNKRVLRDAMSDADKLDWACMEETMLMDKYTAFHSMPSCFLDSAQSL